MVFCEGENTEPTYIRLLKTEKLIDGKKFDLKFPPIRHGFDDAKDFADTCTNAFNSFFKIEDMPNIDSIWLVFDDDEHKNLQTIFKLTPKSFCNGNKVFKGKVFFAFSSMCIEYWILLHFKDHNGDKIYQQDRDKKNHSRETINLINQAIDSYNKKHKVKLRMYNKKGKKKDKENENWIIDNFEFLTSPNEDNKNENKQPRIVEAFQRAKMIHEAKPNGKQYSESVTTFYQLLEYLGVIDYNEDKEPFLKQYK